MARFSKPCEVIWSFMYWPHERSVRVHQPAWPEDPVNFIDDLLRIQDMF